MKKTWPEKAGCLCARMSRGFNGQDAVGLLAVIGVEDEEILLRRKRSVVQYNDAGNSEHPGLYARPAVCGRADGRKYFGGGISNTLDASYYKGTGVRGIREREVVAIKEETKKQRKYIVRRLTPTECARLQGFPDWWTDGADGSDSAKYKLWGNGIALPCAEDVIGRCAEELRKDDEQSLD